MRKYKGYKEHLIEKLKDSEYASAYLNACLEESFETKNMGIFQLAVRDVVEAHGGMTEISSKMEVSTPTTYTKIIQTQQIIPNPKNKDIFERVKAADNWYYLLRLI